MIFFLSLYYIYYTICGGLKAHFFLLSRTGPDSKLRSMTKGPTTDNQWSSFNGNLGIDPAALLVVFSFQWPKKNGRSYN